VAWMHAYDILYAADKHMHHPHWHGCMMHAHDTTSQASTHKYCNGQLLN